MCAGCGGLQALHQIYDVLGAKSVFINAAGCMTLLSVDPLPVLPPFSRFIQCLLFSGIIVLLA